MNEPDSIRRACERLADKTERNCNVSTCGYHGSYGTCDKCFANALEARLRPVVELLRDADLLLSMLVHSNQEGREGSIKYRMEKMMEEYPPPYAEPRKEQS